MKDVLQIDSLTVWRARREVLTDVSFRVRGGEVTVVVGPNGCGKTTLLQAVTGELPARAGRIHLMGTPLAGWKPSELARCRAALPQTSQLGFDFPAREVVLMGRTPWQHTAARQRDRAIVAEVMARLGVDPLADRSYLRLSGGERQRVQLARVFAQQWNNLSAAEPCLLLLDEPINQLDLRHQLEVIDLLRWSAAQGAAVVVVLHDLSWVRRLADRCVVLHDGRVQASDTPQIALRPEVLQQVFGVSGNWIPAEPSPLLNARATTGGKILGETNAE